MVSGITFTSSFCEFQVLKPLDVKTKFYNAEVGIFMVPIIKLTLAVLNKLSCAILISCF